MSAAFQPNAFQGSAFQVDVTEIASDRGGFNQTITIDRGSSIGLQTTAVDPQARVNSGNVIAVPPGVNVVLINQAQFMTVQLPSVARWLQQPQPNGTNPLDGSIMVKDLGGNAGSFSISVFPVSGEFIDGQGLATLLQNFASMRLCPLNDLSGWVSI